MSLLRPGQRPLDIDATESVLIRPVGVALPFHAAIGDGTMSAEDRITAAYELVESGQVIYGEWIQVDGSNREVFGPPTCIRFSSRDSVQWIEAR